MSTTEGREMMVKICSRWLEIENTSHVGGGYLRSRGERSSVNVRGEQASGNGETISQSQFSKPHHMSPHFDNKQRRARRVRNGREGGKKRVVCSRGERQCW